MLRGIRVAALLLLVSVASAQTVRIGVLGLFHPRELHVIDRASGTKYQISVARKGIIVRSGGKQWESARFDLTGALTVSVPAKITRRYDGALQISRSDHELLAVVVIDLESAVARIVKSETEPGTPPEALLAQAIVTRSYLLGTKKRHVEFDFCDTTHCQVFGEGPTTRDDPVFAAVRETRGMVLTYAGQPIGAMFTKSCGGETSSAAEIGLLPADTAYPYYAVETNYCLRNPDAWRRTLPKSSLGNTPAWGLESFRLAIGRLLGWSAIPSNRYSMRDHSDRVELRGSGHGHGLGLCQRGAAAMAAEGSDFRAILGHYFPNTQIESIPR